MPEPLVILDDAPSGALRRYRSPLATVTAEHPAEVPAALTALEAALGEGSHVAGYFSYELGYALEPRLAPLMPRDRSVPLLWFGIFRDCDRPSPEEAFATDLRAYASPLRHEWNRQDYDARFARVHAAIGAGDIYQANLSFRSRFRLVGDPLALYAALRARAAAPHGAFVHDGARHILSLSPELFFDLTAGGDLTARPMKGTAPRGADPDSDARLCAGLRKSPKDRAENLMIVDLLRNDLGRVAELGSVAVKELFSVETYPTVHQMTSTVAAKLRAGARVTDVVRALFPCGSVTGAPKIRAMEIVGELESGPRGVYCGAIGHFAPDGSAQFNVAIRTVTLRDGAGELGIGGAVVHDSTARGEYAECRLKARYFSETRKPIGLIETLRWAPDAGFARRDLHLARMERSASVLGIPFGRAAALAALDSVAGEGVRRVRLTLDEAGRFSCTHAPLGDPPAHWTYAISPARIASGDALLRHKIDWRELYEGELARAGADEVIFLNRRGEIAEGSRSNVFVRQDGVLKTPPLSAGALDGCLRRALLEAGRCMEAALTPDALDGEAYFGNSLRGLIRARRKA
ncbi:MAG TPA: aminodeoxychorismate synthase component I [Rhizomicrobium sp.]|nr:aminodeoxychorismate synthase component I [Rhizomicrobium sp.]